MIKIFIASVLFTASFMVWAEDTFSLSTGFDYSTGKYGGTTSTNILYVPVTGKYQSGNLYLKLTVPYISITSVGDVIIGMGRFRPVTATKVSTQSGLGDVAAAAGYTVFEGEQLFFDLVGKIKFGTADTNLGTGENDYSVQLDGFYIVSNTTLIATAGYKVIGAPAGVKVSNIAYGALGFSQKISDKTSAGIIFDTAQSSNNISPNSRELTFFISNKINKTIKIQANVLKGFSDSSPDFGFGIMLIGTL